MRYIVEKCLRQHLPHVWIGDMPRILVTMSGCSIKRVKLNALKTGDILFLKEDLGTKKIRRRISHIMISISRGFVFHCSEKRAGGTIENLFIPYDQYGANLKARVLDEPLQLLRYIDSRNIKLRSLYKTEFIPFAIPSIISNPLLFPKKVRKIVWQYLDDY